MLKKLFILITLAVAGITSFAQIVHPDLIGKKIAVKNLNLNDIGIWACEKG